jgi:hypothetical protein
MSCCRVHVRTRGESNQRLARELGVDSAGGSDDCQAGAFGCRAAWPP